MRRLLVLVLLLLAAVAATWLAWPVVDEDASVLRRNGDAGAHAVRHEATDESAPRPVVLRGAPPADTPLAADEGGVYGVVLDAKTGAPVPGVDLHALRMDRYHGDHVHLGSAVSDADGRYRLRGLPDVAWQGLDTVVLALGGGYVTDLAWDRRAHDDGEDLPPALRFEVVPGAWVAFDVPVRPAARVEGAVLLPDGTPAVGATVAFGTIYDGRFPLHALPGQVVGDAGRYALDAPSTIYVVIAAERDGFLPVGVGVRNLQAGGVQDVDLRFRPLHRARITVCDALDGTPIEGAEVDFRWSRYGADIDCTEAAEVATDVLGVAELDPAPSDGFRIYVRKDGYVLFGDSEADGWGRVAEEDASGVWTARVALTRVAAIEGHVAWPPGMEEPRGQVRSKEITERGYGGFDGYARVGPDGAFRISTPPGGRHRLTFHGSDRGDVWAATAEVEAGAKGVVLEPVKVKVREVVDYSRWGRWRLTLRTPDGSPVASTHVEDEGPAECEVLTLGADEGLEDGILEFMVEPGMQGTWLSFWFARAADGRDLGRLFAGPFGPEGGERDLVFPKPKTIEGRVIGPGGRPLQGIEVEATPSLPLHNYFSHDDAALTDADGRFVLRLLLQDRYEVSVEPADTWILPPAQRAAAGATGLVFRLGASETRTITVRDARGEPVDHARVILWQQDGARGPDADYDGIRVWTGADGTVAVEGLETGGSYTLRVEPPKERHDLLVWRDREWTPRDEAVVLPTALTVAGRVLDASDRAMARVEVWLEHSGGRTEVACTNGVGRFRFRRVAVGDVRLGACFLEAHADGWTPDFSVTAQAGDDDVVLFLDSARDLDVLVEFPQDERHAFQTIDLTDLDGGTPAVRTRVALPADGAVRVRGLVPGHRYRLWGGPVEGGRYVLAEIGARQTIAHVPIEDGMVIEGRLLLPRGAQKSGVKLVLRGVHCHAAPLRDGTFRLIGVPPGEWTLEAWCHVEGERRAVRRTARGGDTPTFDLTSP